MLRRQVKKIISEASKNNYQTLNLIQLSQKNLEHNIAYFKSQNPKLGMIPVLKANAYGHGLEQVAKMLNRAECEYLAVDGYFEAAKIRDITMHKILVLGYIKPENAPLLDTKKCAFVVQDETMLKALAKLNKPVDIHIEINTGMNRLGLVPDELESYLGVLKKYDNLRLAGVMTHLADADNASSDEFSAKQSKQFDQMVEKIFEAGFKPRYIHIAQTAGTTKASSKYANSIRVGIGIYGINPLSPADKHFKELEELRPVLELTSTIIKLIDLKAGDRVSYNGIFTAPGAMRIGVLPLGYYEGIPRQLSNKGVVTAKNEVLPIVGRVCMNHTMIGLNDLSIGVGDVVTLISNNPADPNSVKQICKSNDLFSYSLLTGLSSSTRRVITAQDQTPNNDDEYGV
jgi:alanine racemase